MDETWNHIRRFEGLDVRGYDPRERGLGELSTTCPRLFTLLDLEVEPTPLSGVRKAAMIAVVGLTIAGVMLWSWWALTAGFLAVLALAAPPPSRLSSPAIDEMWERFLLEENLADVQALVIGPWFAEVDDGPDLLIQRLAEVAPRLPKLRAIFFGDITPEECEISWIEQGDLTPLLHAFPQLETLVVRGANGLRFDGLSHAHLRKLIVQSGGLGQQTIDDLVAAQLPALQHLELWTGDPNYGFESTVEQLRELWQPKRFGALTVLAIRNCCIADEVAEALATQPEAVSRLDRLDLSMGTLTDLGAQALYNNPAVQQLDALDLRHHYLSEDWIAKLESLPIEVDVSDPQGWVDPEDEEDIRYVAVAE